MAPEMNKVAYHNARRRPNVREKRGRAPFSRTEDISNASDGVQQLLVERPIDLLTQAAHQHIDDVGLWIEVVLPDMGEDHRLGYDVAGVADQELEQGEL